MTSLDEAMQLRRHTVDCGTGCGSGEASSTAAEGSWRCRGSLHNGGISSATAEEDNAVPTPSPQPPPQQQQSNLSRLSASRSSATSHGGDTTPYDQLSFVAGSGPTWRRSSGGTSSTHEQQFSPSAQTSPTVGVTDCQTSNNCSNTTTSGSTDEPFRLQLQARVKVSERPVRCLVNARYSCF